MQMSNQAALDSARLLDQLDPDNSADAGSSGTERSVPDGCVVREVDRARVDSLSAALIDVDAAGDLAEMFRLLGDPTRVRILFALLAAGELCVCDIAAAVDTTETKVSQAMRILRHAAVVRNRRDGRNIYYRLDDDHIQTVLELSREHLDHRVGDHRARGDR